MADLRISQWTIASRALQKRNDTVRNSCDLIKLALQDRALEVSSLTDPLACYQQACYRSRNVGKTQ
jgi:hypothetical protein